LKRKDFVEFRSIAKASKAITTDRSEVLEDEVKDIIERHKSGYRNPEIAQAMLISLPLVRIIVKEIKSAWESSSCDAAGGNIGDWGIAAKPTVSAKDSNSADASEFTQTYGGTYWRQIKTDGRSKREVLARF